jgi:carboxymethylenebutenolidase
MCFDLDSRPPIPPIAGAAVDGQRVELRSADGARFLAFDAQAAEPSGAGIVIFPDVRGLHHFYEELALRFAERGVDAIAIDYFGRTAESDDRGEGFDYQPHLAEIKHEQLMADALAAREQLTSRGIRSVFTTGFCMGGRLALVAGSREELGLAGATAFYGWPVGPGRAGTPAPADVAGEMKCPVLAIFGGADQGIPAEAVSEYESALSNAGIDHEVVTYPGAPHSFFDRKAAEFAGASEDAWAKVMEFIERNSAG